MVHAVSPYMEPGLVGGSMIDQSPFLSDEAAATIRLVILDDRDWSHVAVDDLLRDREARNELLREALGALAPVENFSTPGAILCDRIRAALEIGVPTNAE